MAGDHVLVVEFNDKEMRPLDRSHCPGTIASYKEIGGDHLPSINENPFLIQHKIRFPEFQQHLFLARRLLHDEGRLLLIARDSPRNPVFRGRDNHAGRGKQDKEERTQDFHGMILRKACVPRVS